MKKNINNFVDWFLCLTPLLGMVLVVIVSSYANKSDTLYKTNVLYQNEEVDVTVMKDEVLWVSTRFNSPVELFVQEGKIVRKSGIWGARGHLPIILTLPASTNEIALYYHFFP